jgi:hypothetical protein
MLRVTCASVLAAIAISASCERVPDETTVAPADCSPKPTVDTKSWRTVTLADCGIRIKLPRTYHERRGDVVVNNAVIHSFEENGFDNVTISVESALTPNSTINEQKIGRQTDYEGYTECKERISGRDVIVQSFRGGGVITDNTHQFRLYSVNAVFQREPAEFLRVSGHTSDRKSQEQLLAAIYSVVFSP